MELIVITAVWCPSCIVMRARLEKIKAECPWLKVREFNYDKDLEAREKYQIGKEIPVFILLDKDQNQRLRLEGEIDRKDLLKLINEHKDK